MTQDSLQSQKTVLVVAGLESPVTSAVSTLLSSWKLECARDNEEALAQVEKSAFDLVITDQGSSGRENAELLGKIRLVRPHTRLIIVTDRSTPADVIAAIRARAFSYFTKPLSTQALDEMLQLASLVAWRKFDQFDPATSFVRWICRIAKFELAGEPVATSWDPGLAAAMARHDIRVEEELSLDTLLADLA